MTNVDLITYATFGYMACGVLALIAYIATPQGSRLRQAVLVVLLVVWLIHSAAIGLRWYESYEMGIGHAPLSNLYESLVFFGWSMALVLLVVGYRFKADVIVLFGLPGVFLVMAWTFLLDHSIRPLIPALQSNWLMAHVITCFLGYACFAISFVAAIALLLSAGSDTAGKTLRRRRYLDEIVYKSIMIGFPLLAIGIITGAAWADYAWGTYWSWDPKETWSLITWLIYAAFLHARFARGWSGNRAAILSVVGFSAVLFTYFGVNYLPGLHSYF